MPNRGAKSIGSVVLLRLMAISVFLVGFLATAQSQTNSRQSEGGGAGRVTLDGTVEQVLHRACSQSAFGSWKDNRDISYCATTEVFRLTKNGFVNVRLGPTKFIRHNHFFFVDGDRLHVIGFLVPSHGRATVVSEEVVKSKRALTFRKPDGRPVWGKNAKTEVFADGKALTIQKQVQGRDPISAPSRRRAKAVTMD